MAMVESLSGADSAVAGVILTKLAWLYRRQGKPALTEGLCKRALDISESKTGPRSSETAMALNNLAVVYRELGNYSHRCIFSVFECIFSVF